MKLLKKKKIKIQYIRQKYKISYKIFLKKKKRQMILRPFRAKINKLSYKHFLKNYFLNQKQFKFPQLYENLFLYKNNKFNFFLFNKLESISHLEKSKISKLKKKQTSCKHFLNFDRFFFNIRLNFFIIQNFNKIKLKQQLSQNNNFYTVGRILKQTRTYTNILLSVFGIIFIIKTRNLKRVIDKLMRNKYVFFQIRRKKNKKKKLKIDKYFKLEQGRKLLFKYQSRLLRFKLLSYNNNSAKFSRRQYIRLMNKNNKIINLKLFKQKKTFSFLQKKYFLYLKKKKKKVIQSYMYKKKKKKKKKIKNASIRSIFLFKSSFLFYNFFFIFLFFNNILFFT